MSRSPSLLSTIFLTGRTVLYVKQVPKLPLLDYTCVDDPCVIDVPSCLEELVLDELLCKGKSNLKSTHSGQFWKPTKNQFSSRGTMAKLVKKRQPYFPVHPFVDEYNHKQFQYKYKVSLLLFTTNPCAHLLRRQIHFHFSLHILLYQDHC